MKVKVKKISEGAVLPYDGAVLPYKKYDEDFCYDVVAKSCKEVAPNVYKYGLGLAFQIERNDFDLYLGKMGEETLSQKDDGWIAFDGKLQI